MYGGKLPPYDVDAEEAVNGSLLIDGAAIFEINIFLKPEDFYGEPNRLVYEAGSASDGRMAVLLCEHSDLITVGRRGSRGHIRLTSQQLRHEQLRVRWVRRGGG